MFINFTCILLCVFVFCKSIVKHGTEFRGPNVGLFINSSRNENRNGIIKRRKREYKNGSFNKRTTKLLNEETKANRIYKRGVDVNIIDKGENETDDKHMITHLIESHIETCRNNYFPLMKRKFTNKEIYIATKGKRDCYINKVRKCVFYEFLLRCHSNVCIAVDIFEKKNKKTTYEKDLKTTDNTTDAFFNKTEEMRNIHQYLLPEIHNDNEKDDIIRKILKITKGINKEKKEYFITIDGYSDNLVLCSFLHSNLKGLKEMNLHYFVKKYFLLFVNNMKTNCPMNFKLEHILNFILKKIQQFVNNKINKKVCVKYKVDKIEKENVLNKNNSLVKNDLNVDNVESVDHGTINTNTNSDIPVTSAILMGRENLMKIYPYPKVAHMLSGGVDSLMALLLLENTKFDVDNFFFNFTKYDCSKNDYQYVKEICKKRKRKLYVININDAYFQRVLIPMLKDYSEGITPNPDVLCNKKVKYNLLMKVMQRRKKIENPFSYYSYISTGHYAMINTNDENNANRIFSKGLIPCLAEEEARINKKSKKKKRYELIVGKDMRKDQTFFLSSFSEKELSKFLFPLCLHKKKAVKTFMEKKNINYFNKKETKGLCLYGKVDMHVLLQTYFKNRTEAPDVSQGTQEVRRQLYNAIREVQKERKEEKSEKEEKKNEEITERKSVIKSEENDVKNKNFLKDALNVSDLFSFQNYHQKHFNLNYKNYIINIDDEILIDVNDDIHLYTIGQNKHITRFVHSVYNKKKKGNEKNMFMSYQWTVVYKKMVKTYVKSDVKPNFKPREENITCEIQQTIETLKEKGDIYNFIYVTKNYEDDIFTKIRKQCKVKDIKWIKGEMPLCLKRQKKSREKKIIFVKIRNNENIKKAQLLFKENNEIYLKLQEKDIGLSPGQIITFYFPFIVKNKKTKYIYKNINKYIPDHTIYYHCIGSAQICNQFLDFTLFKKMQKVHKKYNIPFFYSRKK